MLFCRCHQHLYCHNTTQAQRHAILHAASCSVRQPQRTTQRAPEERAITEPEAWTRKPEDQVLPYKGQNPLGQILGQGLVNRCYFLRLLPHAATFFGGQYHPLTPCRQSMIIPYNLDTTPQSQKCLLKILDQRTSCHSTAQAGGLKRVMSSTGATRQTVANKDKCRQPVKKPQFSQRIAYPKAVLVSGQVILRPMWCGV